MAALVLSAGGVFGPLTSSKGHQEDTCTCPVGGSVVLASFNWLELELDTAGSKCLKNNSANNLLFRLLDAWRICKFFVATIKGA